MIRKHAGWMTTLGERPKLASLLVLFVVLFFLLVPLVVTGCTRGTTAVEASTHPPVKPGEACSSCKAPLHSYVHREPYTGDCATCHVLTSWRRVSYSHADPDFNQGMHGIIGCAFCHTEGKPNPSPRCGTCHAPDHPYVAQCSKCHTPLAWRLPKPIPRGHVSLRGGHAGLDCFDCHSGQRAFSKPKGCVECHGVKHGGLTRCASCHDPSLGWKPKKSFNHNRFFVLSGRHRKLPCTRCHPKFRFVGTPARCVSCHGVRHGGLTACSQCHTTSAFEPSTFVHARVFPLTGRHRSLACTACHPGGRFAKAIGNPSACVNCHGTQHGGLTACASCHTTSGFKPSTFVHSRVFKLQGAHARIACSKCHPKRQFARVIGNPSACVNCHGTAHGGQTRCDKCHTTTSFSPAKRIAHPVWPPLAGEHAQRSCRLCHPTLVFSAPTKPCSDCHTAPHVGPTDCLRCHTPTYWSDVHFIHPDIGYHTQYPIEQACLYCHTTGNYTTYECDQCHYPFPYP